MRCARLAAVLDSGVIKYNGSPLDTKKKAHFDALVSYWIGKEGVSEQTAKDDVLIVLARLKQIQHAKRVREKAHKVYDEIPVDDEDVPNDALALVQDDATQVIIHDEKIKEEEEDMND